jgi:hypothetical protein
MAVVVPLDSRQASITRLLLTEKAPARIWLGIVALGVLAALGARAVLSPKKATT